MDEIYRLTQIFKLLEKTGRDEQARCLKWLVQKFGLAEEVCSHPKVTTVAPENATSAKTTPTAPPSPAERPVEVYILEHIQNRPQLTNAERALLAAVYLQNDLGENEITARDINEILKSIGYQINNITMALNELVESKPQKLTIARKQGTTQQAQKLYSVTKTGQLHAQKLLAL